MHEEQPLGTAAAESEDDYDSDGSLFDFEKVRSSLCHSTVFLGLSTDTPLLSRQGCTSTHTESTMRIL